MNLLATPGLGSLMAGRMIAGGGQLIMAVAGFGFILVWFVALLRQYYGQISGDVAVAPIGWLALTGFVLFGSAWCWSLATSIGLVRQARRNAATTLAGEPLPPSVST